MADRTKSTSPPPAPPVPPGSFFTSDPLETWAEFRPWRESFLRHLTSDGDRDAAEHVGAMLFELALDFSRFWPHGPDHWLVSIVRAAAGDVRHTQGCLFHNTKDGGDAEEAYLIGRAAEWADRLGEIAAEMEQEIAQ